MIGNKALCILRVSGYTVAQQSTYLLRSTKFPTAWPSAPVRCNYRNFGHKRQGRQKYDILAGCVGVCMIVSLINFKALKKAIWPTTKAAEIVTETVNAVDNDAEEKKIEEGEGTDQKKKKKKEKIGFRDRKVSEL